MRAILLWLAGGALGLGGLAGQDAEPPRGESAPVIRDYRNRPLKNPRVVRFDGLQFDVEHDGGVAKVPWQRMPEDVRARFPLDPARAAELRAQLEERRLAAATAPQPTPTPTPLPAAVSVPASAPTVVRRELRLGELYILSTIGGPAGDLKITNVTQTEVGFSRYKFGSEARELKLGFGEPRTLLFSDGRGCDVYFVNVRDRPRYHAVVEFEYAPGKGPR